MGAPGRLRLLARGVAVLAAGGCGQSAGVADASTGDLAQGAADLSQPPPDLSPARDLEAPRDLAALPDLAPPPDLTVLPDLTPPPCYAAYFDGVAAVITAPFINALAPVGSLTVEAWVYPTALGTPDSQAVVSRWDDAVPANHGFHLGLNSLQEPVFVVHGSPGSDQGTASGSLAKFNNWHHLAGVFDVAGQRGHIYLDGTDVLSFAASGMQIQTAAGAVLAIGNGEPSSKAVSPYVGYISDVRISSGARYTAKFVPQSRLAADGQTLALYHLDEPPGTMTAADASMNKNPGTLKKKAEFKLPPSCR